MIWLLLVGVRPVFGADFKQLHGHVPAAVKNLTAISRLPATNELHLAIGVPLRDPAGLDQFLADVYNPASPNYRHFLEPAEFTARFSATAADYAAVKNFALANGFKITQEHGNRLLLSVTAKATDVERAFHLHLQKFHHPTENRDFFAPDAEPTVAAGLAVVDVSGLSDYYRPHPKLRKMDPKTVVPKNGSAPDSSGAYFGNDFRNAYAPGTTLTGAGQSVGLFQLDGYYANDITHYARLAGGGRTNILVQTVPVGSTNWSIGTNGGNDEVSLDIEMAMAMAPGLSKILVFEGPLSSFPNDILNAMAASNTVKNLSCSWGWSGGPSTSTDTIFQTMAAQGQSFFNASGDSDAFTVGAGSVNGVDNTTILNAPSSSPYITQVGGTTLTTGNGAAYSSETVWNWGRVTNQDGSISYDGSSGGVSSYYSIPSWQTNISMSANKGSTSFRNIPDVALTADNVYVISGGSGAGSGGNGGTSFAAPLWAGFMALVNQQYVAVTSSSTNSVGFINPAIYIIGQGLNPSYTYAACFHDTTTGNNFWPNSSSQYPAVTGYDLCTGWGTPNGTNLINALATPPDALGVTPASGFAAYGLPGGPFSPSSQIFSLTNTSTSNLVWSVINPSAWIDVSNSSGTLVTYGQTNVTISLNSAANSLVAGNYSATVGFSNQTSHVLQNRQCTLQIVDPLTLLTTNGFTAYGSPGGPFNPASQAVVFTNLSASSVMWSLINTSIWFTVSASSGSIAGNSSVSVTVTTNAAITSLAAGNYSASLVLSNQASHLTQSLLFSAFIGQTIVQNGGFETGDFTGWTQSGDTSYTDVTSGDTNYVHSGNNGAQFGPSASLGYLTQTLVTTPGQTYLLSFWLSNPDETGNSGGVQFQANWNNTTLTNLTGTDPTADFNWRQFNYIVTATNASTVLQFSFSNSPDYFGLDDVSVIPVNPPAITQQPLSQTNLVGSNVVFTTTVTGSVPLSFHWRTNGVNLVNNAVVSGATTNVLTLTGISLTNAGNYTLVVTNAYGSITSSVATLTVLLPPTNQLLISTIGLGSLSPNYSNVWLQIGRNYSITSTPAAGFIFTNWTVSTNWIGGVTVTGTNLQFMMQSNLTILAKFFETTNPSVSITNVPAGLAVSNSTFVVKGKASDIWQVTNVLYSLNSGSWSNALTTNAWTNWSATVNLAPGTNTISAYAINSGGNVSPTTNAHVFFAVTNQLSIRTNGLGVILPNYNRAWLNIGQNYSITSAPAAGFVFTNWTVSTNWVGGATVTGTNLLFMMQSNLTLLATFVETSRPTLLITAPTNNQHLTNALATIVGTNTDNWGISGVWYRLNSNTWNTVTATTNQFINWTQVATLLAGTNTVNAYAVNYGGLFSPTNTVSFVSSNTFALQLLFTNAQPLKTNGLVFSLQLSTGLNGRIQVSTNLTSVTNWITLTNFIGSNTVITFRDPGATNSNQRYYRAVIP